MAIPFDSKHQMIAVPAGCHEIGAAAGNAVKLNAADPHLT
jgi:hypothetical protein